MTIEPCKHRGPHNEECDSECPGWDWFNDMEIMAVHECGIFTFEGKHGPGSDDDAARKHIADCPDCQRKLGKHVIDMLVKYECFGVWPVFGDVHGLPPIAHNPDAPGAYPKWWKQE